MTVALCSCGEKSNAGSELVLDLDNVPAQVGVAIITTDGDTVTVNNSADYPLMSVFKLHEALAVADALAAKGQSLDSLLHIERRELSTHTWSPMLKTFPTEGDVDVSVGDLVKYALLESDNNASNLLFDRIVSVAETDSFVRSLDGMPHDFKLIYTEREMQADHRRAYDNCSSPLACVALISSVLEDSIVDPTMQDSIKTWLGNCVSANGRMAAGVADFPGARLYHRTGSGYVNERGEIAAVNDVGVVVLPDGRKIAIAVLVKNFAGEQRHADSTIAAVTKKLLQHYASANGN